MLKKLKDLWNWITGAAAKVKAALTFGKDIANTIKIAADSTLLDVIVKLTPTNIDDAALVSFRLFMHALVEKLNWADKVLTDADQEEKAIVLHTLSAGAAYWKSQKDGTGLNLQTTLSTAQLVYDEKAVKMV